MDQHAEAVAVSREDAQDHRLMLRFANCVRTTEEREHAGRRSHDALHAAKSSGQCYFCRDCGRLITQEEAGLCWDCDH